jgi:hypothetical protein
MSPNAGSGHAVAAWSAGTPVVRIEFVHRASATPGLEASMDGKTLFD